MKQCPFCGQLNEPQAPLCVRCGQPFPQPQPTPPQPQPPAPPASLTPPGFVPRPGNPRMAPPPPPVLIAPRPFTWRDILTILGFVSSVVGCFFASVLLLPLGLVSSILGFRGNKSRGLAVAGIVISAIGALIKVMLILRNAGVLPWWFTDGIW